MITYVFVFKSCFLCKFARSGKYIALFVLLVVSFESNLILMSSFRNLDAIPHVCQKSWRWFLGMDSISRERTNSGSDISLKIMIVPFHNTHSSVRKDI
jgi:hypothetical protein